MKKMKKMTRDEILNKFPYPNPKELLTTEDWKQLGILLNRARYHDPRLLGGSFMYDTLIWNIAQHLAMDQYANSVLTDQRATQKTRRRRS